MNIYIFGDGQAEGKAEMKNLLGGNEANLAEMTSTGLPVPHGMGTLKESGHPHDKIFFKRTFSQLHDFIGSEHKLYLPPL
jgi:hypothetical protein